MQNVSVVSKMIAYVDREEDLVVCAGMRISGKSRSLRPRLELTGIAIRGAADRE